ncbi:MAG: hypothetical protein GF416_03770 [Candidatus Altiarchaeales archaeon]|nr:hypothetical protein [Candidatus Altiarchaeales archaeon]MBD3416238.1 hypothetical protein [Candidatus Altiarchaeales archaeon]
MEGPRLGFSGRVSPAHAALLTAPDSPHVSPVRDLRHGEGTLSARADRSRRHRIAPTPRHISEKLTIVGLRVRHNKPELNRHTLPHNNRRKQQQNNQKRTGNPHQMNN